MQPWFETVSIPADRSWLLFDRQLPEFPFNWHYHPEFELTLTVNSRGMRVVGDHVEQYGDGDLVLLGPDLPHAWQSRELLGPGLHRAIVCWFTRDWAEALLALIPEFSPVGTLLAESGAGWFSTAIRSRNCDRRCWRLARCPRHGRRCSCR